MVNGKNFEDLFREALKGMMNLANGKREMENNGKETVKRIVFIEAVDRTALLVDFLNEILAMSQINKEIYNKVEFSEFRETALRAELLGYKTDEFKEDIKAVTYHEAEIKQNEKGEWETILIFDI